MIYFAAGQARYVILKLFIMQSKSNSNATGVPVSNYLDWLLGSEDGLTDYQLFTLMREGGAV
jgi:hypothetical protein